MRPVGRGVRLLAALACALLLVAVALAASWSRAGHGPLERDPAAIEPTPGPLFPTPTPDVTERPGSAEVGEMPASAEDAESLGGEGLLAAGVAAAEGPWGPLSHPAWPVRERPVYVVDAVLDDRRDVRADVAIAFRADVETDELVLRLLPAARALDGGDLHVAVRRDGSTAEHEVDADGARLFVTLDPPISPGDATVVRVDLRYRLLNHEEIGAESGPAGFGLLARTDIASILGHWTPLLTIDDGPMLPAIDVSSFPSAVWSVTLDSDATVVAGGDVGPCREPRDGCSWIRGVGLREVSLVAYDTASTVEHERDGALVRTVVPAGEEDMLSQAHRPAVASYDVLRAHLGPLAWRTVSVAWAPLRGAAAGMEFPGLVVMDLEMLTSVDGGFGEFVVAHEIAHQWFEALVGSGSLSSPVVDESLAQYLGYVYWAETHGQQSAEQLAAALMLEPYESALDRGMEDDAPARPAAELGGDRDVYALVYGRGALAWIAAEQQTSRGTVLGYLSGVVERHGLGFVDARTLVDDAAEHAPAIAEVLERWWFDPATPEMPDLQREPDPAVPRA